MDDFEEFLDAVARRDLNLDFSEEEIRVLKISMKKFASTARLAHSIAERPEKLELYGALSEELNLLAKSPAFDVFEKAGLSAIFDDQGPIIFHGLKSSNIPKQDQEFLRDCGINNPSDEIAITLFRLRSGYWPSLEGRNQRLTNEGLINAAKQSIKLSAQELRNIFESHTQFLSNQNQQSQPPKKKKYFNGLGKILSGVVAGTGNVLIGVGVIPASGGAIAAGVIASGAFAVGAIMQGIGDLRGE